MKKQRVATVSERCAPLLIASAAVLVNLAAHAIAEPSRMPPLNPDVTPATIGQTICVPYWTRSVRAGGWHARKLKLRLLEAIGRGSEERGAYQLDHVVPLALGGDPRDSRNFALQPRGLASIKDRLERRLQCLVCTGQVPLGEAQRMIALDWSAALDQYRRGACNHQRQGDSQ